MSLVGVGLGVAPPRLRASLQGPLTSTNCMRFSKYTSSSMLSLLAWYMMR